MISTKLAKKPVVVELRVFSRHFKTARRIRGLTQLQIHALTGIAQGYLSELENASANVGLDTMGFLSQAVEVPLYQLLQPNFEKQYDFDDPTIWRNYAKKIMQTPKVSYERTLFVRNFTKARLENQLSKTRVEELSGVSLDFIFKIETGEYGVGLGIASKLSSVLARPLYTLLQP